MADRFIMREGERSARDDFFYGLSGCASSIYLSTLRFIILSKLVYDLDSGFRIFWLSRGQSTSNPFTYSSQATPHRGRNPATPPASRLRLLSWPSLTSLPDFVSALPRRSGIPFVFEAAPFSRGPPKDANSPYFCPTALLQPHSLTPPL